MQPVTLGVGKLTCLLYEYTVYFRSLTANPAPASTVFVGTVRSMRCVVLTSHGVSLLTVRRTQYTPAAGKVKEAVVVAVGAVLMGVKLPVGVVLYDQYTVVALTELLVKATVVGVRLRTKA